MVLAYDVTIIAIGDPVTVLFELNDAINKRPKQIGSRLVAKEVEKRAKENAESSRRTGDLIRSIKASYAGQGNYSWGVSVGVPYAGFVEYGTRKMEAKPFLRPAIDQVNGGDLMAQAIWSDNGLKTAMSTPVIKKTALYNSAYLGKASSVSALSSNMFKVRGNMTVWK